ncbi:hypothetical protein [Streptomyces sp. NPDC051909]|uniref:hypothetical protein n=1 Tax=Streptomyces sp. NPDC051909 TaxID=3154944 RepID=UPI003423C359
MSTEPQRPVSRITEALLPPEPRLPPAPAPKAPGRSAAVPEARPAVRPPAVAPAPHPPARSAAAPDTTAGPRPEARSAARPAGAPEPKSPAGPAPARPRSLSQPLPPERPMPAAPGGPGAPAETPVETTTRLRPVRDHRAAAPSGAVHGPRPRLPQAPGPGRAPEPASRPVPGARTPHAYAEASTPSPAHAPAQAPRPAAAPVPPYAYDPWALGGETPVETTTRLRPVRDRDPRRTVAAAVCGVLSLGLIGGALAGALLADSGAGEPAEPRGYAEARALWHDAPVDTLFPQTLAGPGAGPGGATRTWTRIVVAPDAPCGPATLPRALNTALAAAGCERVLRATYTDATSSRVITVALVFTAADPATMRTLGSRAADEPGPALAAPGTVAAGFGAAQRASWWRHVLPDLPVVVTAVSGFADGRAVAAPEPADRAMSAKRDTPVAQAGLGHEAKGVADAVERALRQTVAATLDGKDQG